MSAGRVLAGRYRLLDQVAVGAMGEVWRAHDDRLDRDVAVKVLRPELADDEGFVERFRAEALHAASVRHPHVAAVHDYGEDELVLTGGAATAYLVMDLLEGCTLGALVETGGPLPEERVARLLAQVADALAAAHRTGLVHRDVKPANLVVQQGPPEAVTVTDFGIARAADAVPVTRTGLVMGTAEYLSPEQARGERATTASDVYSLGVVAHELLAGRAPFTGASPAEVARAHVQDPPPGLPETVSPAVRATVARCLVKDPSRRPGAEELADRLRALADGTAADAWAAPDATTDPTTDDAGGRPAVPAPAGTAPPGLDPTGPAPGSRGPATREIPTTTARGAGAGRAATPRRAHAAHGAHAPAGSAPRRRRRWRSPLRAPAAALLALVVLLLLATVLQQAGLLGGAGDEPAARHSVTGSPGTTIDEDGR